MYVCRDGDVCVRRAHCVFFGGEWMLSPENHILSESINGGRVLMRPDNNIGGSFIFWVIKVVALR